MREIMPCYKSFQFIFSHISFHLLIPGRARAKWDSGPVTLSAPYEGIMWDTRHVSAVLCRAGHVSRLSPALTQSQPGHNYDAGPRKYHTSDYLPVHFGNPSRHHPHHLISAQMTCPELNKHFKGSCELLRFDADKLFKICKLFANFCTSFVWVYTNPVYCTSIHKNSLLYKCTQNQFTVQVYTKPV